MTRPALKSLLIRDFRSISGEWKIPLDAGIVLVHGPNGAGKTSLLSALELATTGTISYLDRLGDDTYRKHLNHRGSKSGLVSIETFGLAEGNFGSAVLNATGVDCTPLLAGQMAQTFVERCFLPQATLGRLFEVYAAKENRGAVTPLARFVKEILGLDAIDALIDGLQSTKHIARVEKLSWNWTAAERRLEALKKEKGAAATTQNAAAALVKDLRAKLTKNLGIDEEEVADEDVDLAINALIEAEALRAKESAQSREALLRLDAIESTVSQERLLSTDPNDAQDLSEISSSEARLAEWRSSRSVPLVEWFATATGRDSVRNEPEPSMVLRELRSKVSDLDAAADEARRRLVTLDDFTQQLVRTQESLADADRRLYDHNLRWNETSSSSASAELASLLVSILDHVDGDRCPVCSQHVGPPGSLRGSVISKVESLNQDAARLLEAERARARLNGERSSIAAQLQDIETQITRLDRAVIESQIRDATARAAVLRSLEPIAEAGQVAVDEVARLRATQASSIRKRTLLDECLAELIGVADLLRVESPTGLITQRIASLKSVAQAVINEGSVAKNRLSDVNRLSESLSAAVASLEAENAAVAEVDTGIQALARQFGEAKRRKEVASDLRKDAERLRTAISSRVFGEQLNGLWAKIFSALVPSEPFVPQFKAIPAGSRQDTVEIETIHRDGLEAASPAAMLSHGNLNTAALSLFVALHFAASSRLPWIIFDDPVQSMDELHISNFASMVKQLTRQNGRQVVIAVHERELFDYLSLELTPASVGEEVLTVELERTYGRSVITWDRLQFREDTALTPIHAA
ncbi:MULTISPECIES: AAA family ATPase [Rhodococcus]|uniref:AAA family ATPase n=1 Tax=Rhodococcus TaxID=1827 RepID=UPI00071D8064|nr:MULTISPECIES: AAA family ATPase [Rhodococcus]KSU82834.1 hypothetical protein AS032_00240 [Rhodococcus qingshengii]MBP2524158.1 exonuclease SbcC [Rhodococcus sp. PvP104]MDA3636341.1 AAA family ATPase [Rhodococcus sp. C-2]SCB73893.1 exonuclease SbcC [Rhodococcus qingshengii]